MNRRPVPLRRFHGTTSELSDEALIAACAIGDQAALAALFDRYFEIVRAFLARISGGENRDLDDLVQVTFETVPRAARGFDDRAPARTWLLGVANNVARHHLRSETRRRRVTAEVAACHRPVCLDGAAEVLAREGAVRLRDGVAAMPIKLREAFVLVYLEGLPGRDVADLVGAREGTIWKRLHEARLWLRAYLQGAPP